ncbi:hypothetical protein GJW-30_1_03084 [Variibacter gotjawalensis]|uniref:Uncharacterized protein n=1 Tax=Variibacter gotjawalensis TaxID=1333996 RepID=A0A0S3PX67_9BRAD|nr:hypothetical protein [Variibacter gotjawalensis]NIK46368.1 hypothetical protein [Variibacter gotjawalensis]RZS48278.1 hypothetical protein EV661_0686 [Variibacter gotjawalensis]BAT60538.1 hypothetical protein GJW-30_1_03084 [Variibacter gotjawalensis]
MSVDDDKRKAVSFSAREPQPSEADCYANYRQLMQRADDARDIERKARLLSEAGEWLQHAEQQRSSS